MVRNTTEYEVVSILPFLYDLSCSVDLLFSRWPHILPGLVLSRWREMVFGHNNFRFLGLRG
jgi:hypothetical protein